MKYVPARRRLAALFIIQDHTAMDHQAAVHFWPAPRRKVRTGAVVCVVALSIAPASLAQETSANYKLRDSSQVDRFSYLTEGSPIPLNKRYSDLLPSERKVLHGLWENIPAGDEPPFPIDGLRPIHAAMARAQQALSVAGPLDLVASVSATGEVTEVKAIGSPSPEMTRYAAAVLFNTKFKPAVCAGKACAMQYPFSFLFKN